MQPYTVINKTEDVPITYPWCYKHEIFNAKELIQILEYCETLEQITAQVGKAENAVLDEAVRRSSISWVYHNEESQWFFDRVLFEIGSLNKQFYNYSLWGTDVFQFASYDHSIRGKYDFHMDMTLGSKRDEKSHARKLSATVLLNNDFVGGSFEFNLFKESEPLSVEMSAGSLIVFPSYLIHRVTEVTSGCRKSLVAWILGPAFR